MLNKAELKQLEAEFLIQHPGGFENPEMIKISKKHKMGKMVEMAQTLFTRQACSNVNATAQSMIKVVSGASMVSLFEKPKFRDFVQRLSESEKAFMVHALSEFLHGRQQLGFEALVDILKTGKLAKWSLLTIIPAYYHPNQEVFVKPTTAKNILKHFKVDNLTYKPLPSWEFYEGYRRLINNAKRHVSKELSPSNAAFSGFLMMSIKT